MAWCVAAPITSMSTTYHEADHPRQTNGRWEEKWQTDQGDDALDDPFRGETLDDIPEEEMERIDAERASENVTCPLCGGGGRLVNGSTCRTCHGHGEFPGKAVSPCPQCGGRGKLRESDGGLVYCDLCGWTGMTPFNPKDIWPADYPPTMTMDDLDRQSDQSSRNLIAVKLLADDLQQQFPHMEAFVLVQDRTSGETQLGTIWDAGYVPVPPPAQPSPAVEHIRGLAGLDGDLVRTSDDDDPADDDEPAADDDPDTLYVRIWADEARQISWDNVWAGQAPRHWV